MTPEAANALSARSTFATAVIAFFALVVAIAQLTKSNEELREATAQGIYKDYLKMAIDTPELAEGFKVLPEDPKLRAKYAWFVSYFLHSAEHVFLLYSSDPEWSAAIANQLCLHKTFLAADEYQKNLQFHYNMQFRELVKRSLPKCPA